MAALRFARLWSALFLPTLPAIQTAAQSRSVAIAMIPDTQNYVGFTQQKSEGFAIDSVELFMAHEVRRIVGL